VDEREKLRGIEGRGEKIAERASESVKEENALVR
jgi:hypothetical protein